MCEIPEAVQCYLDLIDNDEEFPVCEEQKLLGAMVRRVLSEEDVHFDMAQLDKSLSYQKYFPYKLFEWERFVFALHNCLYRADGQLRFPEGFFNMGRGGGKNGYDAFENFCMMLPPCGVKEYNIYSFAMSEDQAKMSWLDVYNILESNPQKFKKFFRWNKEIIVGLQMRSEWHYCTSAAKTKDGYRPGKVDFDEVHEYGDYKLIEVATTGLGKKRHPRRTFITTNGNVRGGVFDDKLEKGLQILNGEIPDNGMLPCIWRLDADEEVNDKRMWHKANPSLRYFPHLQAELEIEYQDYISNPVANSSFMTKRMNRPPTIQENAVARWEELEAASRPYDPAILQGLPCVVGIDYASTIDMISAGFLFRIGEVDYWYPHTWVCDHSPDLPRIKAPLREWEAMGLLTFVHAKEIPPELPACWIAEKRASLGVNILILGIDRYRHALLAKALRDYLGFSADKEYDNIKLLRGADEMQTIPQITAKFAGQRIVWGERPEMRWFANNSKIDMTKFGNMTYQKIEPKSRKTDGFKAFAAAECVSYVLDEAPPVAPELDQVFIY